MVVVLEDEQKNVEMQRSEAYIGPSLACTHPADVRTSPTTGPPTVTSRKELE